MILVTSPPLFVGMTAYILSKFKRVSFVFEVRDLWLESAIDTGVLKNKFIIKMAFWFEKFLYKRAKFINVLTPAFRDKLIAKGIPAEKIKFIPNGVDDFWIEHAVVQKTKLTQPVKVVFIGKFTTGKNVIQLQKAIKVLNAESIPVHLHLIGGGGKAEKEVLETVKNNPNTMFYHSKVIDKTKLKSHFEQAHIFAMPSKSETFGLVYVEAMLQGLPILYTKNEGIDVFYDEPIGEKVSKDADAQEIKQKLQLLIQNIDNYSIPTEKLIRNHDWKLIAKKYKDFYTNNI